MLRTTRAPMERFFLLFLALNPLLDIASGFAVYRLNGSSDMVSNHDLPTDTEPCSQCGSADRLTALGKYIQYHLSARRSIHRFFCRHTDTSFHN